MAIWLPPPRPERTFVVALFLLSAFGKISDFAGTAAYIDDAGSRA
jgi:hypothetical protein